MGAQFLTAGRGVSIESQAQTLKGSSTVCAECSRIATDKIARDMSEVPAPQSYDQN
jgi:hypothetical protein